MRSWMRISGSRSRANRMEAAMAVQAPDNGGAITRSGLSIGARSRRPFGTAHPSVRVSKPIGFDALFLGYSGAEVRIWHLKAPQNRHLGGINANCERTMTTKLTRISRAILVTCVLAPAAMRGQALHPSFGLDADF